MSCFSKSLAKRSIKSLVQYSHQEFVQVGAEVVGVVRRLKSLGAESVEQSEQTESV